MRLTAPGRARFLEMAAEHEAWLVELFDGFDRDVKASLYAALGQLRLHLAGKQADAQEMPVAPRRRVPDRSAERAPGAKDK